MRKSLTIKVKDSRTKIKSKFSTRKSKIARIDLCGVLMAWNEWLRSETVLSDDIL
jgi:hypothetical protein